jgi:lambda repressor-like predicted transcriptional regulator
MSIALSTLDIPKNPAERRAWVCYQLRIRGNSLRQIALGIDVSPQAVSSALMAPSFRIEQAIAAALGTSVTALFPERFDGNGQRLTHTRQSQNTMSPTPGNVRNERAA